MRTLPRTGRPTLLTAALMLVVSACSPIAPAPTPTILPVPGSTETPVSSRPPAVSLTPAASLTASAHPTSTATALPGWVTDFVQPILASIADRRPDFQDDFGAGTGGWQASQNCGQHMEYLDGELVISHCVAARPNMNFTDFVIAFDARMLTGSSSAARWLFRYRDTGGFYDAGSLGHNLWINRRGNVTLGFNDVWNGPTSLDFPHAAKAGNETNHLLVIGKGPGMAILINDQPLYWFEAPIPNYGEFVFWSMDAILGIDNLKVWNISNIPLP